MYNSRYLSYDVNEAFVRNPSNNRGVALYEVLWYEGSLLHNSLRRWSCYSGRRTNQGELSKRGRTVIIVLGKCYLFYFDSFLASILALL